MTKSERERIKKLEKRLVAAKRIVKEDPDAYYTKRDIWTISQELTGLTGIKFEAEFVGFKPFN